MRSPTRIHQWRRARSNISSSHSPIVRAIELPLVASTPLLTGEQRTATTAPHHQVQHTTPEASTHPQVQQQQQQLQGELGDSSTEDMAEGLTAPHFHGNDGSATRWITQSKAYCALKGYDDNKKLGAFYLHMRGGALNWFAGLADSTKDNWTGLSKAFTEVRAHP